MSRMSRVDSALLGDASRDFQRHNVRNAFRCHPIRVSGFTTTSASLQSKQREQNRSESPRSLGGGLYADFCRRAGCGVAEKPERNCIQARFLREIRAQRSFCSSLLALVCEVKNDVRHWHFQCRAGSVDCRPSSDFFLKTHTREGGSRWRFE